MSAPKTRVSRWMPPGIALLFGLPCLLALIPIGRNFATYDVRAASGEARINLRAIEFAERDHFEKQGTLVAAGPVNGAPGVQKREFVPDEGFKALGWKPEYPIRFQYEVRVTGPRAAVLIAKGDVDGDGQVAEYRLDLEIGGPQGKVQRLTPEDVY